MVTSSKRWNHCAVASEFRAAGKHIRPIVVLDVLTVCVGTVGVMVREK